MTGTLTPGEFQVDVGRLGDAINTIQGAKDAIDGDATSINALLTGLEGSWSSPAGTGYATIVGDVGAAMAGMTGLLGEILDRMRTAHANYVHAEETNNNILK